MPVENIVHKYSKPREDKRGNGFESNMLQSKVNIQKITSKLNSMVIDLNQTVAGEAHKNNKLTHTIKQLRKALEMEKKRTMDVDQRLRDEFKEYKRGENEKLELQEKMNMRLGEARMETGIYLFFYFCNCQSNLKI